MIHRAEHTGDFTMINNDIINDSRISAEAYRLLSFMLSCSDEWKFSLCGLSYCLNTPERTLADRLAELKRAGYIKQKRTVNKLGQFTACEWDVFEIPQEVLDKAQDTTLQKNHSEAKPQRGKTTVRLDHSEVLPHRGKPAVIKQVPILNNTNIKQDKSKTRERDEKFENRLASLSPELQETFREFIKMRKTKKAPMTDKALDLAIKKAEKLGDGDPEKMKAVVEQSILNSWTGLFPLKEEPKPIKSTGNEFLDLLQKWEAEGNA